MTVGDSNTATLKRIKFPEDTKIKFSLHFSILSFKGFKNVCAVCRADQGSISRILQVITTQISPQKMQFAAILLLGIVNVVL